MGSIHKANSICEFRHDKSLKISKEVEAEIESLIKDHDEYNARTWTKPEIELITTYLYKLYGRMNYVGLIAKIYNKVFPDKKRTGGSISNTVKRIKAKEIQMGRFNLKL